MASEAGERASEAHVGVDTQTERAPRAIEQAIATSVEALLARYPGRRGTRPLRRVLDDHRRNGETVTRSLLERRLLALVARQLAALLAGPTSAGPFEDGGR